MTKEESVACSLGPNDLEQRLVEIAEVGSESLIDRSSDGGRHLLRFRSSGTTRRRLETIVAAEAACCSFLDLSLGELGDELILSINAPDEGREVSAGLAAAFDSG
jgi:hypothetical protein